MKMKPICLTMNLPRFPLHNDALQISRWWKHLNDSNWKEVFCDGCVNLTTDQMWYRFKSDILNLRDRFAPKSTIATNKWRSKGSIPIDKSLRKAIRNKRALHRRWISCKNKDEANASRTNYNKIRNKVKSMMRKSKRNFERNIARNCKSNPKAFWAHIRSKLKPKQELLRYFQT